MSKSSSQETLEHTLKKQRFAEKIASIDDEEELLGFFMGILNKKGYLTLLKSEYDKEITKARDSGLSELQQVMKLIEQSEENMKGKEPITVGTIFGNINPSDVGERSAFFEESRTPPPIVTYNGKDYEFKDYEYVADIQMDEHPENYQEIVTDAAVGLTKKAISDGFIQFDKTFDPATNIIHTKIKLSAKRPKK